MTLYDKCTATTSSFTCFCFCVRPPKLRLNHHPYVVWMAVMRPGDGRVLNCHLAPQLQRNDAGVQSCFGPSAPIGFSKFSCLKCLEPLVFQVSSLPKAPQKVFQKRGHQSHSQYLTIHPIHRKITSSPNLTQVAKAPKGLLVLWVSTCCAAHPPMGLDHRARYRSPDPTRDPASPWFPCPRTWRRWRTPRNPVDILRIWGNLKTQPASLNFEVLPFGKSKQKVLRFVQPLLFQLQKTSHQIWWFFFWIFASPSDFCTASFNGR